MIDGLKQRNNISGRTIQVADKGLNCINNIMHALKAGDGYIFSKSVKTLPKKEKTWVLLNTGYTDVKDRDGTVLYRIKECIDDFPYDYFEPGKPKCTVSLHEKRVVTYNQNLPKNRSMK